MNMIPPVNTAVSRIVETEEGLHEIRKNEQLKVVFCETQMQSKRMLHLIERLMKVEGFGLCVQVEWKLNRSFTTFFEGIIMSRKQWHHEIRRLVKNTLADVGNDLVHDFSLWVEAELRRKMRFVWNKYNEAWAEFGINRVSGFDWHWDEFDHVLVQTYTGPCTLYTMLEEDISLPLFSSYMIDRTASSPVYQQENPGISIHKGGRDNPAVHSEPLFNLSEGRCVCIAVTENL